MSLWKKVTGALGLGGTLTKTATQVTAGVKAALGLGGTLDGATREALEEVLLQADVGMKAATEMLDGLAKKLLPAEVSDGVVRGTLAGLMEARLKPLEGALDLDAAKPTVVLMVGVNGSGKTTTLGKLAALWGAAGKKVLVAAGDTFRAGAGEQLGVWAARAEAGVAEAATKDAAGVAYAAVEQAQREGADVVMIDTAGRLGNRADLMAELEKIIRVVKKLDANAPHAVLLVLDGTQGQAVLQQVRDFGAAGATGLVVTKLDSSSKAGFLLALAAQEKTLPVYYIGVGEGVEDLRAFHAGDFARGLMGVDHHG